MLIQDIEDALDRRDISKVEAAFRALVEWPLRDAPEDAEDPDELAHLLDRVTAALEGDRHAMPQELIDEIVETDHDRIWFRDDRSYAAGARAVAAQSLHWVTKFQQRLGRTGIPECGFGPL